MMEIKGKSAVSRVQKGKEPLLVQNQALQSPGNQALSCYYKSGFLSITGSNSDIYFLSPEAVLRSGPLCVPNQTLR